jgi:hypothetical protein
VFPVLFGPDWLANVFLFVFLFGVIFTVASLVLGFADLGGAHGAHTSAPVGGHQIDIHVGHHDIHIGSHDGDGSQGQDAVNDGPGILNMPTIMAFFTWFGGVGYLLRQNLGAGPYLATAVALASGLVGGTIMFFLLARFLWPMMSKPLLTSEYDLPGTAARVVSPIRAGGVGEIVYTKGGSRFTAGARSVDDSAIAKGTEVVVLRYERGLAYVQDVNSILDGNHLVTTDEETKVR